MCKFNPITRIIEFYKLPKVTADVLVAGNLYRSGIEVYKATAVDTPFCFSCDMTCIDFSPAINCSAICSNKIIFKRTTMSDGKS